MCMNNKHTKCPGCNRPGTRWGGRRRRCLSCNLTWRIRKKKRGRKRLRHTPERALRYIKNNEPRSSRLALHSRFYRRVSSRDNLRKSLPWPEPSKTEPLILIADAFIQYAEGSWHAWYCILARPVAGEDATILPPLYRQGTEVALGWQEAFGALPDTLLERVKALICDGHNGLILEARRRKWLIQRCHFHLIARLQSKRSRWRRGFHQKEGKQIYRLVMKILETKSPEFLKAALRQLVLVGRATTSRDVRRVISGVMTNYEDYRTYLRHPELNLPITSNTAEAFIGLVRRLCSLARGFRTVRSFSYWIEAVVKARKTVKCRGKTNRIN